MSRLTVLVLAAISSSLAACGGDKPVARACDEHTVYLEAQEHKRVQAPEGLSELDPMKEMPLPEPSPRPPRAADAPCLDLPPSVLTGEEASDEDIE